MVVVGTTRLMGGVECLLEVLEAGEMLVLLDWEKDRMMSSARTAAYSLSAGLSIGIVSVAKGAMK